MTSARRVPRRALFALGLVLGGAALLAGPVAAAGSGSIVLTLSPNRPGAASALTVSAQGPFSQSGGLPTAVEVRVQRGFSSSARSVKVLCKPAQASAGACPRHSRVGSGTATATGTLFLFSEQDTIAFTAYLGVPVRRGDIASVVLSGTDSLFHRSAHAVGRLFRARGRQLELLFSPLPKFSVPAGTTVTLDSLKLTVHAARTVVTVRRGHRHRTRYALITNPRTCSGSWHGTVSLSFTAGPPLSETLSVPCRGR